MSSEKDNTKPRVTWLLLSCQTSDGKMHVMEIPHGNAVDLEITCTDENNTGKEIDIANYLSRPPHARGIKITIHATNGDKPGTLMRTYMPQ